MRGEVRTGHQDVIQVDKNKRKIPEKVIHEHLKRLCSVVEPKGHLGELEKSKRGDNGCVFSITIFGVFFCLLLLLSSFFSHSGDHTVSGWFPHCFGPWG